MTPEEGMRLLNDPDEWDLTLHPRPNIAPQRRPVSPWVVSFGTIAAVAVVGVIVFSIFGLSIQNVRQPALPPAVPTSTATRSPEPTPSSTPTATSTPSTAVPSGAATCESLLDPTTVTMLKSAGEVVTDDAYTQKVVDEASGSTRVGLATFVNYGGLICGWGGAMENSFMYGYGPITSDQSAAAVAQLVERKFTKANGWPYDRYEDGPQAFAFTDGYWAYSYNNGGGDKLDEVTGNAPGFAHLGAASVQPATPAKAPYLTSEGLGDLRLGAAIPNSSPYAKYDRAACESGAWRPKSAYQGTINLRALGAHGKLQFILLYDATIPTKSGIRVGDSEATLLATYDHFDAKPSATDTHYEIDGTVGKVVFEMDGGRVAAIGTVPKDADVGSFLGGDAWGYCVA
jgi:hypothetical protein